MTRLGSAVLLMACAGEEPRGPLPADSSSVETFDSVPPPSIDSLRPDTLPESRLPVVGMDGPWAYAAWNTWRDTATVRELVDTAVNGIIRPTHAWGPPMTWEFVVEELGRRAAGGAADAYTGLVELVELPFVDRALARSLAPRCYALFAASPVRFAEATAALTDEGVERIADLLLDWWLERAIAGRDADRLPSARLASVSRSIGVQRLQARLAVREPEYLRALRLVRARRRETVS